MRWIAHWICHFIGHICSKLMFDSELLCHVFYRPYQTFMKWSWKLQADKNGKWWAWSPATDQKGD